MFDLIPQVKRAQSTARSNLTKIVKNEKGEKKEKAKLSILCKMDYTRKR